MLCAVVLGCSGCTPFAPRPRLVFPDGLPSFGVSGLVRSTSDAWTFGTPPICLDAPGTATIREVVLEGADGLRLTGVGVKQLTTDAGLGGTDATESMEDHGYHRSPLVIPGACRFDDPEDEQRDEQGDEQEPRPWSMALEVRPTSDRLEGIAQGLRISYTIDGRDLVRTAYAPMTIQLCRPGSRSRHC